MYDASSGGNAIFDNWSASDGVTNLPMQLNNYQFVKVGDGMSTSEKIR